MQYMKVMLARLREIGDWCRKLWEVLKRPQWGVTLCILLLAALADAPAGWAVVLMACFVGLVGVFSAFYALGIENPFNPLDHLRAVFTRTSFTRLFVAAVLIGFTFFTFKAAGWLIWAAEALAVRAGGDGNLMLALIFSLIATLFCALISTMKKRQLKIAITAERSLFDAAAVQPVDDLEASQRYWSESSSTLILVVVALVPAALLANWAWNTLASVAFPLLILSLKNSKLRR